MDHPIQPGEQDLPQGQPVHRTAGPGQHFAVAVREAHGVLLGQPGRRGAEDGHAGTRLAAGGLEQVEERGGEAVAQGLDPPVVQVHPVPLGARRERRIPLVHCHVGTGLVQPLCQAQATEPAADDQYPQCRKHDHP